MFSKHRNSAQSDVPYYLACVDLVLKIEMYIIAKKEGTERWTFTITTAADSESCSNTVSISAGNTRTCSALALKFHHRPAATGLIWFLNAMDYFQKFLRPGTQPAPKEVPDYTQEFTKSWNFVKVVYLVNFILQPLNRIFYFRTLFSIQMNVS